MIKLAVPGGLGHLTLRKIESFQVRSALTITDHRLPPLDAKITMSFPEDYQDRTDHQIRHAPRCHLTRAATHAAAARVTIVHAANPDLHKLDAHGEMALDSVKEKWSAAYSVKTILWLACVCFPEPRSQARCALGMVGGLGRTRSSAEWMRSIHNARGRCPSLTRPGDEHQDGLVWHAQNPPRSTLTCRRAANSAIITPAQIKASFARAPPFRARAIRSAICSLARSRLDRIQQGRSAKGRLRDPRSSACQDCHLLRSRHSDSTMSAQRNAADPARHAHPLDVRP